MKKLRIAAIGCGHRTSTYVKLAAAQPDRYETVAAADPIRNRVLRVAALSQNPYFQSFPDADSLLAADKIADLMIIGSQDAQHCDHAIRAMEKGYDLLLEKPIANYWDDVQRVEETAIRLQRKVLVCHVLRYTPFYQKIKEIVDSGTLGDVLTIHATEGVGAWHQAHSFVRGHWSDTRKSSPMILAKSCHDMDLLRWIADRPFTRVSSAGSLTHFKVDNAPAGAPLRCYDGCPVAERCHYFCEKYLHSEKAWFNFICDIPDEAGEKAQRDWLHQSPWGRCVYHCGNDAVDHQTVLLEFEGGLTASFNMTAFESGRHIEIFGTEAKLRGGGYVKEATGNEIQVRYLDGRNDELFDPKGGDSGHGGGDAGLMNALYDEMEKDSPEEMTSSLQQSVESHRMAFEAERSRLSGQEQPAG